MSILTTVHVSGMTCSACSSSVTSALESLSGVSSASVSLITEEAQILHDTNINPQQLVDLIDNTGFDARILSTNPVKHREFDSIGSSNNLYNFQTILQVGGMTCSACENSITFALSNLKGVSDVTVSLLTEEAVITHNSSLSADDISNEVEEIGFTSQIISSAELPHNLQKKLKTELSIDGMTCSSCVNTITTMLESNEEVDDVTVSLMTQAAVVFHSDSISPDSLKEIIEDCGFEASITSVEEVKDSNASTDFSHISLKVFGMTCSNCSDTIEQQVNLLDGIIECNVSALLEEAQITFDNNVIGVRAIIKVIEECGFDAIVNNKLDTTSQIELLAKVNEINYWSSNFFKLLLFGIPIMFLSHIYPLLTNKNFSSWHGLYLDVFIQFVFGTYIQFFLGRKFYINSYKSLRHGYGNMDVLICTSTSIIYLYSTINFIISIFSATNATVLYDASAMLFTFVSLGKWVESRAKGNTSTVISKLLQLTPPSCIIVKDPLNLDSLKNDSIEFSELEQQEIGIDLLQKNDVAIILPGAKIPADGQCIFGYSEVDESLVTGESMPVCKIVGSKLIAGSVNLNSTLFLKVEKIGDGTQIQQIVKLVKDAQIAKAPIQRFADYIASIFVPTILILACLTLTYWSIYINTHDADHIPKMFYSSEDGNQIQFFKILQVSISVIVVACPCALGLSAPTAVMVGTGVGASNGILIKGGDVLEKASKLDTIIFDKTGTVTQGKMKLTDYAFLNEFQNKSTFLWTLLYDIEQNSEHPIAKAITATAKTKLNSEKIDKISLKNVVTHAGLGIEVDCDSSLGYMNVKIGNSKFIHQHNVSNKNDFDLLIGKLSQRNKISSFSYILINEEFVGYLELSDSLKYDSKVVIQSLMNMGYSVGMVTGDSLETSEYVAKLLNLPKSNLLAEASPEQKLEYIKELQEERGLTVAFVGDGINDAPALVQADVGIAISSGTDIAMSAADIVLLSSDSSDHINEWGLSEINSGSSESSLLGTFAALSISRATFNTIKVNFLLAIIYNIFMIPIAMGLLIIPFGITMDPMLAAACMAVSSTSVVGNSLRLKWWNMNHLKEQLVEDANLFLREEDISNTRKNVTELSTADFLVITSYHKRSLVNRTVGWFKNIIQRDNDYEIL